VEVPRLGVELELYPSAYTTVTATRDLSCIFDLYHSSWQRQILNPLKEARDQTHILMVPRRVHYGGATTGTPPENFSILFT